MNFSERNGYREIKIELDKEELSVETINILWTLVLELIIDCKSNDGQNGNYSELTTYFRDLYIHFFKLPIDEMPRSYGQVDKYEAKKELRKWFFKSEWNLILDFVEFTAKYHQDFEQTSNQFLKREMSAYRFVEGKIIEINSKEEIIEIENAIKNSDKFSSVKTHLKQALDLLSDRKTPDYRNSIKESISSVESLAKIITNNDKTTLGQALKEIENKHQIPGSLKSAFSALYGYTSDESGIRHSLLETSVSVGIEEARFMLITCSAFVNYLINKI